MGDNGKAKWTRKRIRVEGNKYDRELKLQREAFNAGGLYDDRQPMKYRPFANISIKF